MKMSNTFAIAFKNIFKNKTRSILTSLGIIIGVSSVTIMVGIGQGTQQKINSEISSMGTNLIMIFPGANQHGGVNQGAGSANRLTLDDYNRIKKDGSYIQAISPSVNANEQVIGGGNNWRTQISGIAPDFQVIRSYELESGEFINEQDVKTGRNVAVLGATTAEALFPGQDPVGERILVGKNPFSVVGLLTSKGQSSFGSDQDDVILIPYTTALNKISGSKYLRTIFVSAMSSDLIPVQQEEIRTILREQHHLRDGVDDDFRLGNQTELADRASSITKLMTLLLGSIAAVSLLVGGIGIMNIMLVSVTERTREIGIRMAVGALKRDIMLQFLVESFVLSLAGGTIGISLSLGVAFIMNNFTSIGMAVNIPIITFAFVFSGAVGLFFGLYPAKKAASLNPIEALRYE